jgi:hypothetical protein
MRRVLISPFATMLAAMALAQQPTAPQNTAPVAKPSLGQITPGGAMVAELARSVDAKKAKADDKIEARLTMDVLSHGRIVIPRGTKIVGHVIDARPRTKRVSESRVEIAFERILIKNGREIPLKATIQAVGVPIPTSAPANLDTEEPQMAGPQSDPGRNEMRRILGNAFPGSVRPANSANGAEEPAGNGGLHGNSPPSATVVQGVVRMKGIALSNTTQGSAITSTSENVHLSRGTQLLLRVTEPQVLADSLARTKN